MKSVAVINKSKCTRCGKCSAACLQDSIVQDSGYFTVLNEKCLGCGICGKVCNFGCIGLKDCEQQVVLI